MNRLPIFILLLLTAVAPAAPLQIRVATFNASLNRTTSGQLATDLAVTTNTQAQKVAEIIQRVRPDILLLNEFDYDPANPTLALTRFHDNYLAVAHNGQAALSYPYRYVAPSNTGVPTGAASVAAGDFDNNGAVVSSYVSGASTTVKNNYGNDCFGFGWFPGQYSFAVYSKYPILTAQLRSFQFFKWQDMPAAVLPDDTATGTPNDWYSTAELGIFRLSSKNHVDLPIELLPGHLLHLLASHPTPPAFESGAAAIASDYNGHRNHDEIRLWADYISGAAYLYDDQGGTGGLATDQRFIALADMNADPLDGDSYLSAMNQLFTHPLINATFLPASAGGASESAAQGGVNASQHGNPANDTSDFYDGSGGAGNLSIDHVFPSKLGFSVTGGGVFWPAATDPLYPLLFKTASFTQSNQVTDHRLVWLDLTVLPIPSQAVRNLSVARQGSDYLLSWQTQPGVTYTVEQSPDLSTWSATPTIPITFDTPNATATALDAGAALGPQKFYRLSLTLDATAPALPAPGVRSKVRPSPRGFR